MLFAKLKITVSMLKPENLQYEIWHSVVALPGGTEENWAQINNYKSSPVQRY